ncbi:MAG: T9SS type A sorting domain-containing protein, partial [Calditrichia bacterium]
TAAISSTEIEIWAGAPPTFVHNDIQGGWQGEGNIDAEPQFVAGDSMFHLTADPLNPCVNSGADSIQFAGQWYWCPPDDYEGDERPYMGSGPDMGADETQAVPVGIVPQAVPEISRSYALFQNYPNPFNPTTTIELALPHSGFATLKIYNILGEEVATLVSERLTAGKYKYEWDAGGLASGVYLYRIETGSFIETRKLILLK